MFDRLDPRSPTPLYAQIAARIKVAIVARELPPGHALPSVRQLAVDLRVNPATVAQAYRDLEAEGFVELRQGAGTFVRDLGAARRARARAHQAAQLVRRMLADAGRLGLTRHDIEAAIARDPLFEQVMLLGEGKSYLAVMAVLSADHWKKLAGEHGLDAASPEALRSKKLEEILLSRISAQMKEFPGHAQVRRAGAALEPWTIENGLLTPTMKVKRRAVEKRYQQLIEETYAKGDAQRASVGQEM